MTEEELARRIDAYLAREVEHQIRMNLRLGLARAAIEGLVFGAFVMLAIYLLSVFVT